MARVLVTALASDDQAAILTELSVKARAQTTARFRSRFTALFDRLAEYPLSGAPRPVLGAEIRIGIVAPYIVIYRFVPEQDTVIVLRLVHGRSRITPRLLSE